MILKRKYSNRNRPYYIYIYILHLKMPLVWLKKNCIRVLGFFVCFQRGGEREKENGLMNSVRVQSTLLKITWVSHHPPKSCFSLHKGSFCFHYNTIYREPSLHSCFFFFSQKHKHKTTLFVPQKTNVLNVQVISPSASCRCVFIWNYCHISSN